MQGIPTLNFWFGMFDRVFGQVALMRSEKLQPGGDGQIRNQRQSCLGSDPSVQG